MLQLMQPAQPTENPVPSVGADLLEAESLGYFAGLQADRLMAVLELLRHGELSPEQGATLAGISTNNLKALMERLPIPEFHGKHL